MACVGSSGVGKSTLVNHWLAAPYIRTQPVRQRDQRGQHTTTYRELHLISNGCAIIDTPGMREFGLAVEGYPSLPGTNDIEQLATGCRFTDCEHRAEPGCAVQRAIEAGIIEADRVEHLQALSAEARAHSGRASKRERRAAEREFGRSLARARKRGQIRHRR